MIGLVIAAIAIGSYFVTTKKELNPVTGENQRLMLTPQQEVALGLQAAPEMAAQHGGEHPDAQIQAVVDEIGNKLVAANSDGPAADVFRHYRFDFHVLRDAQTVNAFALPGGQVFFTYGLMRHLKTKDEIAGVLGHEIGHVVGRHSNEQMAKSKLWAGLAQAGAVAGSDYTASSGQIAQLVYTMKTTKFGRDDENQADELGVKFMHRAGYNPDALIRVMEVLKSAGGGGGQPEFFSTHPDPGNRIEHIKEVIAKVRSGEQKKR
ncbi:MAG: M48 family metalloprotease [Verrucomicrobiales bacterium]